MAQKVNESLDMQGVARVLNLPVPAANSEPARLAELNAAIAQFSAAIAGLSYIENPVVAIALANVNVASPGATFDGVAPVSGDPILGRLLLAGQTTNTENGTYVWNGATSPLTRTADHFVGGSVVVVGPDGATNKKTLWLQTVDSPVVGSTALQFSQFGSSLTAGAGLQLIGSVLSLVSPVAVANGGTNATSASAARTNLAACGFFEADFGDGSSGSFTITHGLGKQYVHVMIFNKSTGAKEDCAIVCNSTTQCALSAEAWTAAAPALNSYRVVVVAGS